MVAWFHHATITPFTLWVGQSHKHEIALLGGQDGQGRDRNRVIIRLQIKEGPMEPKFIHKSKINLVGMSFYGDPFSKRGGWDGENEIGRLWARLMAYLETERPNPQPAALYEVHIYTPETPTKGFFEVFVGFEIAHIESIPLNLLAKTLPATEYGLFSFAGQAIVADWHLQIDEWIQTAGYQRTHPFSFQYYDHRFKGLDQLDGSILDVYLPVKPRQPEE